MRGGRGKVGGRGEGERGEEAEKRGTVCRNIGEDRGRGKGGGRGEVLGREGREGGTGEDMGGRGEGGEKTREERGRKVRFHVARLFKNLR